MQSNLESLTAKQQAVFDYLYEHQKTKGYPPTVREIGKALGVVSSSTIHNHLVMLETKGYIRRTPSSPRALEILYLDDVQIEDRKDENESRTLIIQNLSQDQFEKLFMVLNEKGYDLALK